MRKVLGIIETFELAQFIKRQSACRILRHPEKPPNLGSFSKLRFEICHILVPADLVPAVETVNKRLPTRLRRNTLRRLNDISVCLLLQHDCNVRSSPHHVDHIRRTKGELCVILASGRPSSRFCGLSEEIRVPRENNEHCLAILKPS